MVSIDRVLRKQLVSGRGLRVVLVDVFGPNKPASDDEISRNIFCLDPNGRVIWQIFSSLQGMYKSSAYVNITLKDDSTLVAYNSNGMEYEIDLQSGAVKSEHFFK